MRWVGVLLVVVECVSARISALHASGARSDYADSHTLRALAKRGGNVDAPPAAVLVDRDAPEPANATADNSTNATKPAEGRWAWVKAYVRGGKDLWAEVKLWRSVRKERGRALTWREMRAKARAPTHALRMLPLLANPLPPPFGLVLVGIAARVPRTLLTPQFWTDGQCRRFASEDFADARRRHAKLLVELSAAAGPVSATGAAEAAPVDLGSVGMAFGAGEALDVAHLKRRHLIRLARCVRPRPLRRVQLRLSRTATIRRALGLAAEAMAAEDAALAHDLYEGEALSERELLEALAVRGVKVDGDGAALRARLRAWCDARETLLSTLAAGGEAPASLVLHMPALLSAIVEHAAEGSSEAAPDVA